MKYILNLLMSVIPLLSLLNTNAQQGNWIDLKLPQSNLLGLSVLDFIDGMVTKNVLLRKNEPLIDEDAGPDTYSYCNNKLAEGLNRLIGQNGFQTTKTVINKIRIKTIQYSDMLNLDACNCYIYQGMCADSYQVTISTSKKNLNSDNLFSLLKSGGKENELTDVIQLLDSVQDANNLIYKLQIKSPDVYFKIRMIRYNNVPAGNRYNVSYFLYKTDKGDKIKKTPIPSGHVEMRSDDESNIMHPGSVKKGEFQNCSYKIYLKKTEGILKAFLTYKEDQPVSTWKTIELDPISNEQVYRHWSVDELYVNNIVRGANFKSVYVSFHADQIGEDKIMVYNYDRSGNTFDLKTGMTYHNSHMESVDEKTNCRDHQEQVLEDDPNG